MTDLEAFLRDSMHAVDGGGPLPDRLLPATLRRRAVRRRRRTTVAVGLAVLALALPGALHLAGRPVAAPPAHDQDVAPTPPKVVSQRLDASVTGGPVSYELTLSVAVQPGTEQVTVTGPGWTRERTRSGTVVGPFVPGRYVVTAGGRSTTVVVADLRTWPRADGLTATWPERLCGTRTMAERDMVLDMASGPVAEAELDLEATRAGRESVANVGATYGSGLLTTGGRLQLPTLWPCGDVPTYPASTMGLRGQLTLVAPDRRRTVVTIDLPPSAVRDGG